MCLYEKTAAATEKEKKDVGATADTESMGPFKWLVKESEWKGEIGNEKNDKIKQGRKM